MSEQALIELLQQRFKRKPLPGLTPNWAEFSQRLAQHPDKLQALQWMQDSGGEPALIGLDEQSGEYLIADYSAETPKGRRSLCYDDAALAERKEHKPAGSAVQLAAQYGLALLTEAEYQQLQQLLSCRNRLAVLGQGSTEILDSGNPHLFCYQRELAGDKLLALVNFSEQTQHLLLPATGSYTDELSGQRYQAGTIQLAPYQVLWLTPVSS